MLGGFLLGSFLAVWFGVTRASGPSVSPGPGRSCCFHVLDTDPQLDGELRIPKQITLRVVDNEA